MASGFGPTTVRHGTDAFGSSLVATTFGLIMKILAVTMMQFTVFMSVLLVPLALFIHGLYVLVNCVIGDREQPHDPFGVE